MADVCVHSPQEIEDCGDFHFFENESTFEANVEMLPAELGEPYVFMQAYKPTRGNKEISVRYIPTTNQGFQRIKSKTFDGRRDKTSQDIGGAAARKWITSGLVGVEHPYKVAVKFRYPIMIHGRCWFIDYLPLTKVWKVETEFETQEAMQAFRNQPMLWPAFLKQDWTASDKGYTRNDAKEITAKQFLAWEKAAKDAACKKDYAPPEPCDEDIDWIVDALDDEDGEEASESKLAWAPNEGGSDAWIGVDFDGTLAKETTYNGSLGEPVPSMLRLVKKWLADEYKVKIFSARAHDQNDVEAIRDWTEKHLGERLEVTNQKDHHLIAVYDDKTFHVEYNTGEIEAVDGVTDISEHISNKGKTK